MKPERAKKFFEISIFKRTFFLIIGIVYETSLSKHIGLYAAVAIPPLECNAPGSSTPTRQAGVNICSFVQQFCIAATSLPFQLSFSNHLIRTKTDA